jgi:acid phosphatase type 7
MDTWTGEEKEWLRSELAAALDEPGLVHRIAVLHHGPFSSGNHGGNVRLHANGIVPMLRDNKVELVLAGHDHVYERGEGQGIKYIVSGGAGAPLYKKNVAAPETKFFEPVHHFLEVAVDGENVTILARRAIGSIIEKCSFRGVESWSCSSGESKGPSAPTTAPAQASSSSCACEAAGRSPGRSGGAGLLFVGVLFAALRRRR